MGYILRNYTWYLHDLNLRLISSDYSINSPKPLVIGDSLCKFFLQFNFHHKADQLSVFLCRSNDDGPTEIRVKFTINLKSTDDLVLYTFENSFSFQRGISRGFFAPNAKQGLSACMKNMFDNDALIITCDTIALNSSFTHLNKDIELLSEDLLKLRNEKYANAYLITDGSKVSVHKEILSVRSLVFERMFRTGYDTFETPFTPAVVEAMLDFLYSGNISKVDFDRVPPMQLYKCATYYEIPCLTKLLSPRISYISSAVDYKNELHLVQFTQFTKLCKTLSSAEYKRTKMTFDENVEMRVKLLFESYNETGKIIVETSLHNMERVKCVNVRLFVLDNFNNRRVLNEMFLEPQSEETIKFNVVYESEKFFSENLILPSDVLSLQYEFKFRLPGEFHISDPDVLEDSEYEQLNHGASYSLVKSMERLLSSKLFADASLLVPSRGRKPTVVHVHKFILSARSPVLGDLLRTEQNLLLDFPKMVTTDLLHYIYTGVLVTSRLSTLDLLHKAAVTYKVDTLKHTCEERVTKIPLDVKNVLSIYAIAFREENLKLKETCADFIQKNKDIFLGSYRWERFRINRKRESEEIYTSINVDWEKCL